MSKLLSYSGIITKIKAMEASFVSKSDYQKIAGLETVSDFITYLKNHPGYMDIFQGLDEHTLHRGDVEGLFINSLYLAYAKIYRFSDLSQRKALNLLFFRYEVNVLKDCMKLIYTNKDTYDLSLFDSFFKRHSKINVNALASSRTMDEYINNLKSTEYYPIFTMLQNTHNLTSFDYEMQLDIYYYKKSWKLLDKLLSGDNLKAFKHSFGTEIDLLNILWLYRSTKFYNIPSNNLYAYVIPVNYKLTKGQLTKLTEAVSIDEFINLLKSTHYEEIVPELLENSMEFSYRKIISKIYKDNASLYPASMAPISNYLFLKQTEINRLTTALECIRYKLEPQDTLRYILE